MLSNATILCIHGWGYSASYWKNFTPLLEVASIPYILWDLGYFSQKHTPIPTQPVIAITHSLGYIKLLQSKIPFIACMVLQGFHTFLGEKTSSQYKRRLRFLNALHKKCTTDIANALRFFYTLTGYSPTFETPNTQQLLQDYLLLYQDFSSLAREKASVPHIYCYSDTDTIVPPDLFQENFPREKTRCIANAAHTLGYTQTKTLYRLLEGFLQK